jgi:hypothetical protein
MTTKRNPGRPPLPPDQVRKPLTVRLSPSARAAVAELAKRLDTSLSGAVEWLATDYDLRDFMERQRSKDKDPSRPAGDLPGVGARAG